MKCWNSTFNAQGWKGVIVCTFISSENICSNNGGILGKKKTGWNSQNHQIDGFLSFTPHWMLMYFFASFFLISPYLWPNSSYWCCLFLTLCIPLMNKSWSIMLELMHGELKGEKVKQK